MNTRRQKAFSLIEIMVSMTLLALIVTGLLVVFNSTTRALRAAHNSTDVFEGARATVSFVTRDFAAMSACNLTNEINLYANSSVWPAPTVSLPDGTAMSNVLHDIFFLTHENDRWMAVGYFIDRNQRSDGVGTLYRFDAETNGPYPDANWFSQFLNAGVGQTHVHRITDGVVQFELTPFDAKGRRYFPISGGGTNEFAVYDRSLGFTNRNLPAHIELQIGLLEPETTRKFNALNPNSASAAQAFLANQAGKMHIFRQRVAIRNHTEPPAFD